MSTLLRFRGPWKGIVSRRPPVLLQPNEAVATNNVVFFDEVLQKGIPFSLLNGDARSNFPVMITSDPSTGYGIYFDSSKLYKQNAPWPYNWDGGTAATSAGVGPVIGLESQTYGGVLYYSNGSAGQPNQIGTFDGAVVTPAAATYVGGFYMTQLVDHLILGYCNSGANQYATRVSWSASGLPLVWDPAVNVNAGFTDFLMVNDYITGLGQLDQYVLVYSHTGIQWMIPTGSGLKPFDFRPMFNAKDNTIGNYYPRSRAGNGQMEFFVSQYDVQMLTLNGMNNIGGEARSDLFDDIAQIPKGAAYWYNGHKNDFYPSGPITSSPLVMGSLLPGYDRFNVYPIYVLMIPQGSTPNSMQTVVWVYEVDRDRWTRTVLTNGWFTNTPLVQFAAKPPSTPGNYTYYFTVGSASVNNAITPVFNLTQISNDINNTVSQLPATMSYTFPTAETDGKFLTVTRLRFMYKDEAVQTGAVINFIATYSDESGVVYTTSSSVTINYLGDGLEKQVYADFQFSGLLSSLQMSSNYNPYMISLEIIGTGQELDVM